MTADPVGDDELGQLRKDSALRLLAAIASKDRAAASDCVADAVAWWVPSSAAERGLKRPLQGRAEVLELICGKSAYQAGSMRWQYHHVVHEDGIVVVHCSLRALTAAGRPYDNQYCLIYRFEGALVVEGWEHTDTAYAFARFQ